MSTFRDSRTRPDFSGIAAAEARAAARRATEHAANQDRFIRVHTASIFDKSNPMHGWRSEETPLIERVEERIPFRWELRTHEAPRDFAFAGQQSLMGTRPSDLFASRIAAGGDTRQRRPPRGSPRRSPRTPRTLPKLPSEVRLAPGIAFIQRLHTPAPPTPFATKPQSPRFWSPVARF